MNEQESSARSDWYRPESAAPPEIKAPESVTEPRHSPVAAPYSDTYWTKEQAKKAKKRATLRTIGICAMVVLLIVATAFIFSQKDQPAPLPEGEIPEPGMFDDYKDFFESYYTDEETTTGENDLERAPTGTGVKLTLETGDAPELSLQEVYEKASPSIVSITAEVDDSSYYWGSGIVMTDDGYVLTNTHVLEGVKTASVTLSTGEEYNALIVGYDAISDIAVLKIDATGLTPAEFADSASLRVGDKVVAIGNPLGEEFRGTMTDGIISAIDRFISYNGHSMTVIQTNAAINEGNSGGALLDLRGRVVGITNMKMMSYFSSIEGIGFAIPTATMKTVVDTLIESGRVSGRPALGITVGAVPDSAADYYDLPEGLYISKVSKGSDAEAQGIRVGDVLTAVNGERVTATSDVSAIKDTLEVGDVMTLTIYRSGKTFDVTITLMDTNDIY